MELDKLWGPIGMSVIGALGFLIKHWFKRINDTQADIVSIIGRFGEKLSGVQLEMRGYAAEIALLSRDIRHMQREIALGRRDDDETNCRDKM